MDAEQSLQQVALFQELKPKLVKNLAKRTTMRTFQPGQVIVSEGQAGMGLYCIGAGKVKITQNTANGSREVRTMSAGESFGELSLLDNQPRAATVTAVEPTTAYLLDKAQFLGELQTYPEIALTILPVLVRWLRDADHRIAELSSGEDAAAEAEARA